MAFRQTTFNPGASALHNPQPTIDFPTMEEQLAREMARMKMEREKQKCEVDKICQGSEELKALQASIKAAYLNKERASQMAETQFRKQIDIVSTPIHSFNFN